MSKPSYFSAFEAEAPGPGVLLPFQGWLLRQGAISYAF
jgi:hypothetical protein